MAVEGLFLCLERPFLVVEDIILTSQNICDILCANVVVWCGWVCMEVCCYEYLELDE